MPNFWPARVSAAGQSAAEKRRSIKSWVECLIAIGQLRPEDEERALTPLLEEAQLGPRFLASD
jgi:hypothetical protein